MTEPFADRLADAVTTKGSALVVGLDPQLERFPTEILEQARRAAGDARDQAAWAIRRFHEEVVRLVAPFAAAVKPQIAFHETYGAPGFAAYEDSIRCAQEAGLLVIGDIKRGDIGSTAEAYAAGHVADARYANNPSINGYPRSDAVTLSPYLGSDSIVPFLSLARRGGCGMFVLVRTSNPSARELQDLPVDGRPLHEHVADLVVRWGSEAMGASGWSSVGAVVGATAPRELARLRGLMPNTWFLVPGVGAQGATAADVAPAFGAKGLGAVVNSSRGILYAYKDPARSDWREAIALAARSLRDELRVASSAAPAAGAISP